MAAGIASCAAVSPAWAQQAEEKADTSAQTDIVVTGTLEALPDKDVGSIFGFGKTLVETPRSASTISSEQIERFGITDIYDLVAQAPGTFTNSFFGVGGALDIRGTPGEVYFRGVRRLENPGNYPTPIGASERIDIVRGPSSPIYGPSKTGGYLNFVPKSARVKGGQFLDSPEGQIEYTAGTWAKSVLDAYVRGPASIAGHQFGYSLYVELEDSGSYYNNVFQKQTIAQASFDTDIASNVRAEFGAMYHNYKGVQNGGWNRLTQALVDDGTYITGQANQIDANGDGLLEASEFGLFAYQPFFPGGPASAAPGDIPPELALTNVGTTTLSRKNTLAGPRDRLDNVAWTAYFDVIADLGGDLEIKNQLFYDGYRNINENSYGFSQFHNSYVIEDKIVLSKIFSTSAGKISLQLSPSYRYTNFQHGDDFTYEFFHRVDLSQGYDARSARVFSTQSGRDYSTFVRGYSSDIAVAGLVDLDFNFGLDIILGGRFDSVHVDTNGDDSRVTLQQLILDGPGGDASGTDSGWSWSASANYKLPFGLVPYGTVASQTTLITGQGAEIYPADVRNGTFLSASTLYEGGIKGSWLNGKLYAALSVYKQERTDFNNQNIVTNQAVETEGLEVEARWSVDRHLLLTAAYTNVKVSNLTGITNGSLFSFFGVEDFRNSPQFAGLTDAQIGGLIFGGQPGGNLPITNKDLSRRAGIPENTFSFTGTYAFDFGLAVNGSLTYVDSVFSGQSQAVRLPSYTLVDVGLSYSVGRFLFRAVMKNATDARYFRANFTELFGSTIALPEKPRGFQASVVYKF